MARPRTADGFAVIGARLEELCRLRAPMSAELEARPAPPRPYRTSSAVTPIPDPRRLPPALRQSAACCAPCVRTASRQFGR